MPTHFQPGLNIAHRHLACSLIETVLKALDPQTALAKHFDPTIFTRPTHILAFGKASIPMTNAAIACLGDRFARATVISTPQLCAQTQFKNPLVELLPADHPLPSRRNIDAANRLIEHAKSIPSNHQALILISGGGSALLCAPRDGITLEHIIQITNTLLKAGAPIQEINRARSKLETLKAGGLANILDHVAQADAFVLCDVIGDDRSTTLQTIASGPVAVPSINHTIIASNQTVLDTLIAWLARQHINLVDTQRQAIGPAADLGKALARKLINSNPHPPFAACLGGEPTVDTTTSTSTQGSGGPMLELALAGALELARTDFRWTIITFATDGIDGPTDAAGAIITSDMLTPDRLEHIGIALDAHNTLPMCDLLGATIRTGQTGTNVNDLAIAIRWDDGEANALPTQPPTK